MNDGNKPNKQRSIFEKNTKYCEKYSVSRKTEQFIAENFEVVQPLRSVDIFVCLITTISFSITLCIFNIISRDSFLSVHVQEPYLKTSNIQDGF